MNFDLSEEQVLLQDSATALLAKEFTADHRKAALADGTGFDRRLWRRFAEMGWLALPISEASGGLGGGAVDSMVLAECMGAVALPSPWLGAVVLAGRLMDVLGDAGQREAWLGPLVAGEKTLALAVDEPRARYCWQSIATTARADGADFVIDGAKSVVLNGQDADAILIVARSSGEPGAPGGLSVFLVEPAQAAPGSLEILPFRNLDGTRSADLRLDGLRVPGTALIGPLGGAGDALRAVLRFATLVVAAGAVGAMGAANRLTLDYLNSREQFGSLIGRFQALQHRAVDMVLAQEMAKSITIAAAIQLDEDAPGLDQTLAAAKYQIGESGRFIGKNAVQLHGGIGVSQEFVIGHYFKYLLAADILMGDRMHQARLFREAA